jgi:dihydrofolate synthase/folylpolyglutamate synthase
VAVVTNIALEHTEYLGDTISAIAGEKLAILDTGADLVTGELHPDALAVAEHRSVEQAARWYRLGPEYRALDAVPSDHGWVFDLAGIHDEYTGIDLRLRGRHQVTNFAVAVAAVECLFNRALDEAAVRETAALVTSPGRLEVLGREPWLLTDGAHNPAGMEALAAALAEELPGVTWTLVLGAMRDKDVPAMLDALRGRVKLAHTAAADSPRAMSAPEVAALVEARLGVPAAPHGSVAEAVAAARRSGEHVLVTGSLYVVGEARKALGVG